jgi:hypothetical protein
VHWDAQQTRNAEHSGIFEALNYACVPQFSSKISSSRTNIKDRHVNRYIQNFTFSLMSQGSQRWERPSTAAEERRALRRARRLCKESEQTVIPEYSSNNQNSLNPGLESPSSSLDECAKAPVNTLLPPDLRALTCLYLP